MYHQSNKAVTSWLFVVAALVAVMVVVGGYVRLARAGLSIVEWNPVTGVIPPLTEQAWQAEFAKYRETPEFKIMNPTMTLDGYKRIFYLEWAHRLIARLAGLVVVVPLAWFLWRRIIPWRRSGVYLLIAGLFAFQGFLGWYMVASGLVDRPHVSHFRLTIHLLTALTLLGLALWTGLDRAYGTADAGRRRASWPGIGVLAIILLQIAYGGLVAGLKAGHVANTWPLMLGALVPAGLLAQGRSVLFSLLEAPLTVHFIHRWLAFVVLAVALWFYLRHPAAGGSVARQIRAAALLLVGIIVLQIALGIGVVLFGVPLWLALAHQATALAMFVIAVYLNHRLAGRDA
ncbi:MAG: COX15/CtaA family protein [Anaerolineae bacterium]